MASFENSKFSPRPAESGEANALRQGRLMFSRYRLQRLLGRGGMGVVWLAHDSNLDRPAALKFLPEIFLQDPVARDDMKNETRRSLQLTHPNIVRIYDFIEDREAAAISMEYVDGATLSHLRVERPQRCFEAEGLHAWVADLCCALEYAHRDACVVHRDLKPANLMITSRGSVKVADFGISRSLHNTAARVSAWHSSGGTLGYMSPQQLEGELPSASDDIYSVGATLYELLTSKPPFYSGDVSLQIRSVVPEKMADRRIKLGVIGEPIPNHWEETIAACLSKNTADRPATARELARLLGIEMERTPPPPGADAPTLSPRLAPPPSKSRIARLKGMKGVSRKQLAVPVCAAAILIAAFSLWPRGDATRSAVSSPAIPVQHANPPPAVPAVEPPAGIGGIMLKTNPPGARVVVDGRDSGATPLSIPNLPAGAHLVEIGMPGFDPVSSQAQVRPNQFTDLGLITLQRSLGTLQITSQPEGSDYVLSTAADNHEIRRGQTPDSIAQLPAGDYRLQVTHAGWPAQEQKLTVERAATRVASSRFGVATLQVTTDPPGAEIVSDGKSLGVTPLSVQLPSGHYEGLTAKLADFQSQSFSAELSPDETAIVPPLILKPIPPSLSIVTDPPGLPFQIFSADAEGPPPEAVRTGETPADIDGLQPGAYRMVLGGDLWPARSVAFQMSERGKTTLSQELPHGTVNIESQPPGAGIFKGDTLLGTTPTSLAIPPGTLTLVAKIDGHKSASRTVVIAASQTKTIHFELKANPGAGVETEIAHHRRKPRTKAQESELDKIGRSLKTLLFGKPQKKKADGT